MDHNQDKPSLNPTSLTVADAARLLTKVGGQPVTVGMLEADLPLGPRPTPTARSTWSITLPGWSRRRGPMPTDPRKLRPSELCRLLNSTPLGEVITEQQLNRQRTRAGLRIGDAHHVDLLRYVAWLVQVRHAPKPQVEAGPSHADNVGRGSPRSCRSW